METLAAINRWLAKQHVVTGAWRTGESYGAPMHFISTIRTPWRFMS